MALGLKGFHPSAQFYPQTRQGVRSQAFLKAKYLERNAVGGVFKRESLLALLLNLKQRYKYKYILLCFNTVYAAFLGPAQAGQVPALG